MYDSSLSVNYIEVGKFTKCGVHQMWILKTSKDLLEYIQSRSLSSCNSINTSDFFTRYTSISHSKLKDRLKELVQLCSIKEWPTQIHIPCVRKRQILFKKKHYSDSTIKYSETDIINMLVFLIDARN